MRARTHFMRARTHFMRARTHYYEGAHPFLKMLSCPEPTPPPVLLWKKRLRTHNSVVELVLACLARNSSTYCCAVEDSPTPTPPPVLLWKKRLRTHSSVVELVLACLARNSPTYCCAVEDSHMPTPLPVEEATEDSQYSSRAGPCMSSSELPYLLLCS